MARVTRDQHLVISRPLDPMFAVSQMPGFESGVDANFVCSFLQLLKFPMAETKSPCFTIVGGAIRNPIRRVRQGEEMWSQFRQRHSSPHWHAVIENMQIASLEVHNAFSRAALNIAVPDVPFVRNSPIKNSGTGWYLAD